MTDRWPITGQQRGTWTTVLRLAALLTGVSGLVVLGGGSALWLIEGEQPGSTLHSWGDALWWSLTTLTTVGYGDHVPVTTAGRMLAAGVMVVGVAVIGVVAAIVALAVARRVAVEEERAFEAEAGTLEHRLEARLDRIETQLARLDARLMAWPPTPADHGDRSRQPALTDGMGHVSGSRSPLGPIVRDANGPSSVLPSPTKARPRPGSSSSRPSSSEVK